MKELEKLREYERLEAEGYLLRLPIALGTEVYVVEHCCCGSHYDCRKNTAAKRNLAAVEIIEIRSRSGHSCKKIFKRPFAVKYLPLIGKKVFRTFEEARESIKNKEKKKNNEQCAERIRPGESGSGDDSVGL